MLWQAVPLRTLLQRNTAMDPAQIDEVFMGCANQSGEDNCNVARMNLLLAGVPHNGPGVTLNRLYASSLEAVGAAAFAIHAGEMDLAIAGGVESMIRAPFVMGKASKTFDRSQKVEDPTIGWRFINPALDSEYGSDPMPRTTENLAAHLGISRGETSAFDRDEHPRADTTAADVSRLKPLFGADSTVTAAMHRASTMAPLQWSLLLSRPSRAMALSRARAQWAWRLPGWNRA